MFLYHTISHANTRQDSSERVSLPNVTDRYVSSYGTTMVQHGVVMAMVVH
jgi:hypothetical protein